MDRINWSGVRPGDIIYLDGGTSGMTYNTRMVSGAGGTAQNPILIQRSEASGHNGRVSLARGMEIRHPYITVDGKDKRYFEIPPNDTDGYVIRVLNGGNFFTLRNVYVHGDQRRTGGELLYGGSYPLVRGLPNITIQNAEFRGLNGGGEDHIKYNGQGTLLIEDSMFSGILDTVGHCAGAGGTRHCDTIQIDSGGYSNLHVRRSRFYDAPVVFMGNTEAPLGNLEFTYNIFSNVHQVTNFNDASSVTMDNNVFDRAADIICSRCGSPTIRNNIYTGINEAWDHNHVRGLCNNCLFDNDTRNEDTSGTGNIRADPRFNNKTNRDFSLRQGSPAINAGLHVGLSRDIAGNPIVNLPDIGAYERETP
jgi:hypothetical protein